MKTVASILLVILVAIVYSCEKDNPERNSHRIKQINYEYAEGNDKKAVFTYQDSKLTKVVYSKKDDFGTWEEYQKSEVEYVGNRTINTRYSLESGIWEIDWKSEYLVENELITEESFYFYDGSTWRDDSRWNYQYSGKDLVAWQSYVSDDYGNMAQDGRGDYHYSNGVLTEYLRSSLNEYQSWTWYDRNTFNYTNDLLSTWTDYNVNDYNQWEQWFKCVYEYAGKQVSGLKYYKWNAETQNWGSAPYSTTSYGYDSNGYLTEIRDEDGSKITYVYEEGHGNAKYFWYYPENLVYNQPTLKSAQTKKTYVPYFQRIAW